MTTNNSVVKFTIDGKEFTAINGETILAVAQKSGINIPTLCHNNKISHTTSCFVCVVKDEKNSRFIPSCASLPAEGGEYHSQSKEVTDMRRSALELLLSEHSGDCEAPCTIACPAHANVEEYVREGQKGNFLESLKIIKERIPLPMSIGRVCPRFCEKDCRRNIYDEPVAINEFKRLAADLEYENYIEECKSLNGKKVAIIGAGPAGLSAAYYLRREGVASSVFEMNSEPGGMLRYGIPEFRLPKAFVKKEVEHFKKLGSIEFFTEKKLGRDIFIESLKKEYDAVGITIGSQKGSPLRCEGEELAEVGVDWLHEISENNFTGKNPGTTIVIGGGNTAMDCVRTAVRLGSKDVGCYYRRTENEMPAEQIEINEAKEEGVDFVFLNAPLKIEKVEDKLHVTFIKMELGEKDASGRRRPVVIEGSEFTKIADTVIAAVGQKTVIHESLVPDRFGNVEVNENTLNVKENIFAAGDCVTGPASVVEAVAAGRKMALSIIDQFENREHIEKPLFNVSRGYWKSMSKDDVVLIKNLNESKRLSLKHCSIDDRKQTFNEITITAPKGVVKKEGERCLECSCTAKHNCTLKSSSELLGADIDAVSGTKHIFKADIRHPVIIHDPSKCIKCGICVKICDEVIGLSLLGYKNRGFDSFIAPALFNPLPDTCGECMACVDECPVGALDRKHK
ncbi:MAG: FAD-dependent oxidoreductase [Deltaproteobacteria bacterium]|nr:FAD-dependent oxidoreductase [Deltaproteobacteria bacterium]